MWIDADAMITGTQPIDGMLEKDFVVGADDYGINMGVFFMRNCGWSRRILSEMWEMTQFTNHMWWEQKAAMVLHEEGRMDGHIKIVPMKGINSRPNNWEDGDFVLHVPGESDKYDILKKAVAKCGP